METMGRGEGPAPGEEVRANPGCHLPPVLPTPTLVKDFRYVIHHLLNQPLKNKFTNHELILVPTQTNLRGREWTIGKPLGQGGFGAIYLIEPGSHKKVDDGAEYVVKVSKFFLCS